LLVTFVCPPFAGEAANLQLKKRISNYGLF